MDSQSTPSRRAGDESAGQEVGRSAAQSPRAGQAPKPKSVFNSIISPVLTLFHGKPEDHPDSEPSVVLEVSPLVAPANSMHCLCCMSTLAMTSSRMVTDADKSSGSQIFPTVLGHLQCLLQDQGLPADLLNVVHTKSRLTRGLGCLLSALGRILNEKG